MLVKGGPGVSEVILNDMDKSTDIKPQQNITSAKQIRSSLDILHTTIYQQNLHNPTSNYNIVNPLLLYYIVSCTWNDNIVAGGIL